MKKFILFYLLPLSGINLFLQFMPLANIMGYEFSVINSVIYFIIAGIYIIKSENNGAFLKTNLFYYKLLLLILIPLIISFYSTIFIRECDYFFGLQYFLVISTPSILIGGITGFIIKKTFKKYNILLLLITFLIILFSPLYEIYYYPQIYFYNPIITFFNGTLFDESINIDYKIISYRIISVLTSLFILFIFVKITKEKYRILFLSLTFIVLSILFLLKPKLGFATDNSRIKEILGGTVNSENFEIIFDQRIRPEQINLLKMHHEYFYEEIKRQLGYAPENKIISFVFYNADQKLEIMGAGLADVAKPWLYQIYITPDSYSTTLKHELAHIFSAEIGSTPFKLADGFNPAIIEGFAMAVENMNYDFDVHYMAGLAKNNNVISDIEQLFSGLNFLGQVSTISYTYAGSFIKYLMDKYGIMKVNKFYSNGNLENSFNKSIKELNKEYLSFLDSLNYDFPEWRSNYYYGRNSIFSKKCSRIIARKLDAAADKLNQGAYDKASMIYDEILLNTNSYYAVLGKANLLVKENQFNEAINFLLSKQDIFKAGAYKINMNLFLADICLKDKDLLTADSLYRYIYSLNITKEINSIVKTRLKLISIKDSTNDNYAVDYALGSDFDKYEILRSQFDNYHESSFVYPMINISKKLNEDFSEFFGRFNNELSGDSSAVSDAYFFLSEYALLKSKFNLSRDYLIKAIEFNKRKEYEHLLLENLRKVNFFINQEEINLN